MGRKVVDLTDRRMLLALLAQLSENLPELASS